MKRLLFTLGLALGMGVLAQGEPLRVVTTFSVLGDLVQNVAGDAVEHTVLVGPDADSHNYEPSPADVVTLGDADLIVENGLEFETWLDDLVRSSGSDATRVVASDGIDPLPASELEEHEGELHEEGEEHGDEEHEEEGEVHEGEDEDAHGESDPHAWHDVRIAMTMVENIRAALVAADPANAETYTANAEAYTAELADLDAYIEDQVATIPEDRRKLVTSHDTFGYFARQYGFEVVGTVIPSVSTEVADPAAGELAGLIDEIESTGVPAIFAENVTNPGLLEQVASSAGVTVAPTLYTDALGAPGSAGGTYLDMERYNVDTIVQALGE